MADEPRRWTLSIRTAALAAGGAILVSWTFFVWNGVEGGKPYEFMFWFGINGFAASNLMWGRWEDRRPPLSFFVPLVNVVALGAALFKMGEILISP